MIKDKRYHLNQLNLRLRKILCFQISLNRVEFCKVELRLGEGHLISH